MDTNETYVSLETAKLLKQAGFDWETVAHWVETDMSKETAIALTSQPTLYEGYYIHDAHHPECYSCVILDWNNEKHDEFSFHYSAPSLEVAQRWLREKHIFDINVLTDFDSVKRLYYVRYVCFDGHFRTYHITENRSYAYFNTYEEALEAGIQEGLKFLLGE